MNTCQNCKNSHTKYSDLVSNKRELDGFIMSDFKSSFSGDLYVKCDVGHNDVLNNWWKNNGRKTTKDLHDEVFCFEPTEFSVRTQELIDLLDELKNKLNK